MLTLATVAAAVCGTLLPAGCSSGGTGCASQSISMQNVVLSSISAAFDVHVTVKSSDSKPITGASVDFTAWGAQPGQTGSVGVPIGTATTDASGHATLAMPAIVQGYEVSGLGKIAGTTFVKIGARTAARTVSGTSYCEGDADEPVSCGAAGQACPVISVP